MSKDTNTQQVLDWRCVVRRYNRQSKPIDTHPQFAQLPLWLRMYLIGFQRGLNDRRRKRR